jgi:hypothetical protein
MSEYSAFVQSQAQAIRTDLFCAAARPELLCSLIFANFLSPRLRELALKAVKKSGQGADHDMHRLHKFLNGRLYHGKPVDFARMWGVHELERSIAPGDRDQDLTIMALLRPRLERDHQRYDPFTDLLLENGAFPNYLYCNADLILAHGRRLDLPGRSLGMTSCLDECLLTASLAVAGGLCGLDDLILVGSPCHYTIFLFQGADGWWFNGKREILNSGEFAVLCESMQAGTNHDTRQLAFDSKVGAADRIVTAHGAACFSRGRSSLERQQLEASLERLAGFLGIRPKPFDTSAITEWQGSEAGELVERLSACADSGEAADALTELAAHGLDLARDARCAFRLRDAAPPEAFALAAKQGYQVYLRAATVESLDEAVELVRAIPGREPVFTDRERIGLPDEVLLFQTAGPDERALLLHTLLCLSPSMGETMSAGPFLEPDGWVVRHDGTRIPGGEL